MLLGGGKIVVYDTGIKDEYGCPLHNVEMIDQDGNLIALSPPPAPPPVAVNEIEWAGKLSSVCLGPGDVLIVMVPKRLGEARYEYLAKLIQDKFPKHEHVILEEGTVLGVLGQRTSTATLATGETQ